MSLDLYVSTVLTLMARTDEISLLDLPSATSRTISCSLRVRRVRRGRTGMEDFSPVAEVASLVGLEAEVLGIGGEAISITKHPTCMIRPRLSVRGKRFSIQRPTPDRLGNCPEMSKLVKRCPEEKTFSHRGATLSAKLPRISWKA